MAADGGDRQRLFIGIPLTDSERRRVARLQRDLDGMTSGVRLVPEENLHVTMKFLGDCDAAMIPALEEAVSLAAKMLPLRLRISGVGGFPSQRSARIIWAGAAEETGALQEIFSSIEKGVSRCGVPKEKRSYRPHVTVGRARNPIAIPSEAAELLPETEMPVDEIFLYRSDLSNGPPVYTVIGRAKAL